VEAYFDQAGHPRLKVSVVGSRAGIVVDALIDTGFDGDICLPTQLAIQLGLDLRDMVWVELADGTLKDELVFAGVVVWEGENREAMITLTESQEALLGTGLLADSVLEMDFARRQIIVKKANAG
jgi:clan AA aspartic protease